MTGSGNNRINELGLVDYFSKFLAPKRSLIFKGIGDDAAVVKIDKNRYLLCSCDMLIEGKHFRSTDKLFDVGYKAISCSLSDIAAMGGKPKFALVSLGLPNKLKFKDIRSLFKGIRIAADKFLVQIIGGDTNSSDGLVLDISMMGFVEPKKLILRSNAKVGDYVFVTGSLGGSIYRRHLRFAPRVKEVQFLTQRFKLNSMIDVSDGLVIDLWRILKASGVGAVIFESLIPIHKDAKNLDEALYMGEDFELLFSLSQTESNKLLKMNQQNKIKFPLSFIGKIIEDKPKVYLVNRDQKRIKTLKPKGFLHF